MTQLLSCISLVLIAATINVAIAQTSAEDEQLLKAAFIYNFAKFTSWPEKAWQAQDDSLNICTAGNDKLVAELMRLGGKTIKNRQLIILPMENIKNQGKCQLLYIATSEKKRYKDILASIPGQPILTVSELTGFGRSGGIIELYRENNQTRFIINLAAAGEAGLVISSRLLILAVVIGNEVTP